MHLGTTKFLNMNSTVHSTPGSSVRCSDRLNQENWVQTPNRSRAHTAVRKLICYSSLTVKLATECIGSPGCGRTKGFQHRKSEIRSTHSQKAKMLELCPRNHVPENQQASEWTYNIGYLIKQVRRKEQIRERVLYKSNLKLKRIARKEKKFWENGSSFDPTSRASEWSRRHPQQLQEFLFVLPAQPEKFHQ